MSNEELVVLIQGGERDKLPELWAQVERFVAQQARRLVLSAGLVGVEFVDLYNAGYLALVAAVDSFDPGTGRSFISWLTLALKTAFAEAGGYRSRKQSLDPLHRAGSLDVPVGEDEDSATLGELQEDPSAAQALEDAEERMQQERLHAALRAAIATLPPNLQAVIWRHYFCGEVVDSNAHSKALRLLRTPKCSRALREYL